MGYFTAIFRPRLQFGLAEMLAGVILVALACMLYRYSAEVFWTTLAAAAAANLLGWVAGWFVTHIWGLPNDGSDPLKRDEEKEPHRHGGTEES